MRWEQKAGRQQRRPEAEARDPSEREMVKAGSKRGPDQKIKAQPHALSSATSLTKITRAPSARVAFPPRHALPSESESAHFPPVHAAGACSSRMQFRATLCAYMHLLLHPFRSPSSAPLRISCISLDCISALFEACLTVFGGFCLPHDVSRSTSLSFRTLLGHQLYTESPSVSTAILFRDICIDILQVPHVTTGATGIWRWFSPWRLGTATSTTTPRGATNTVNLGFQNLGLRQLGLPDHTARGSAVVWNSKLNADVTRVNSLHFNIAWGNLNLKSHLASSDLYILDM
ncbi:hypothetical protein B0H19DRAFT_1239799 [Mycena capillaripes]|nr:hypothetical protein B0H19DRAFT_1239799 [Mycena capillaripes]